ncbi:MAG: hypothetical protein PHW87_04160 [Methanothrix sp.]|nr:hypothetical protein [Methanothrix sp.]
MAKLEMVKIAMALFLYILLAATFAGADGADTSKTYWDWLGVGPIYSYGPYYAYQPYYTYYYPAYSYAHSYSTWPVYAASYWYNPRTNWEPYYYYSPYFVSKYPTNVWWVGTHGDLPKTLDIARSGSSMRIYSNGIWRTP